MHNCTGAHVHIYTGEPARESCVFQKVLQGHACGVMRPCGWLLNLLSQVCLFVLEIITSVAPLCSAPLPRPLCRHVFICLVIIAWSWMSWFRDSAWMWVCVCVCQGTERVCDAQLIFVLLRASAFQWWRVDIGVCDSTLRICVCNSSQQKKGHRKLNIVHFLFKLFKQRHRLKRWQQNWVLMSYCTCIGNMKQLGKKCILKTLTQRVPGHQLWA